MSEQTTEQLARFLRDIVYQSKQKRRWSETVSYNFTPEEDD